MAIRWLPSLWLGLLLAGVRSAPAQSPSLQVEAATKPGAAWKSYATRTLDQLPTVAPVKPETDLSPYGGWLAWKTNATGFFHPAKQDGRWWLVDPAGYLFLHQAVVSVTPLRTPGAQAALREVFGSETNWAARTTALLREDGFNGLGAWSDTDRLRALTQPLVYTRIWNFMSNYGKKRGGTFQQPGHTGYPKDCIFVFDPEFETFCDEHARQLAASKDDPWLLGHFSDNEMPLKRAALTNYLALPAGDPGQQAALAWLRQRHGPNATGQAITPQDLTDFLALVVDQSRPKLEIPSRGNVGTPRST